MSLTLGRFIGGTGVNANSATIIGSSSKNLTQLVKNLTQLVKDLFANNEQGFFYDHNDLSTMYQDAVGTIPVTAAGQPVGLVLDKSRGLVLGGERWDHALIRIMGQSSSLEANKYRIYSPSGAASQVSCGTGTPGKWYEITLTIESIVSGAVATDFRNSPSWNSTGVKKFKGFLLSPAIAFKRSGTTDAVISNISVKELLGNPAYQTVSALKPLLAATPQRLDYDAVNDKLITNLPAQLTDCTVVRSVPNVGTQILTGQTIPATYEDNTDHCGLLVINRALTPSETSDITAEFNKRAGV